MSDSIHRRKVLNPVGNGRSSRTRRTASRCVSDKNNRLKLTNHVFERSFSEPSLNRRRDGDDRLRRPSPMRGQELEPIVYLPRIRSEVFASSPSLSNLSLPSSSSPINQEVRALFFFLILFSKSWLCKRILHLVHKVLRFFNCGLIVLNITFVSLLETESG